MNKLVEVSVVRRPEFGENHAPGDPLLESISLSLDGVTLGRRCYRIYQSLSGPVRASWGEELKIGSTVSNYTRAAAEINGIREDVRERVLEISAADALLIGDTTGIVSPGYCPIDYDRVDEIIETVCRPTAYEERQLSLAAYHQKLLGRLNPDTKQDSPNCYHHNRHHPDNSLPALEVGFRENSINSPSIPLDALIAKTLSSHDYWKLPIIRSRAFKDYISLQYSLCSLFISQEANDQTEVTRLQSVIAAKKRDIAKKIKESRSPEANIYNEKYSPDNLETRNLMRSLMLGLQLARRSAPIEQQGAALSQSTSDQELWQTLVSVVDNLSENRISLHNYSDFINYIRFQFPGAVKPLGRLEKAVHELVSHF